MSDEDDDIIMEAYREGKSDPEIALLIPHRSIASIKRTRVSLGLVRDTSQQTKRWLNRIVQAVKDGDLKATPGCQLAVLKAASIMHLVDLKRAEHSPRSLQAGEMGEGA